MTDPVPVPDLLARIANWQYWKREMLAGTPPEKLDGLLEACRIVLGQQQAQIEQAWQPIATAPKDGYILVTDGALLPDIVRWHPGLPERFLGGCRYLAVPEGWFTAALIRSRVQPTHWLRIPAVPEAEGRALAEARDQLQQEVQQAIHEGAEAKIALGLLTEAIWGAPRVESLGATIALAKAHRQDSEHCDALSDDAKDAADTALGDAQRQITALRDQLRRHLDNHCGNADQVGMSALCECKLCLDTRKELQRDYAS